MLDDEIVSASGNDDDNDDGSEELSQTDEIATDNVINKLVSMANTGDVTANVSAASDLPVSTVLTSSSTPEDVQAMIVKAVWEKKNIRRALTNAVRDTLPTFKKQIQKDIKKKMPKVVLKPLLNEFNALNKLESKIFVILQKQLSKSIKKTMAKAVKKNVSHQIGEVEKTTADLHELVGLVSQLVRIVYSVAPPISVATEGEKESQAQAQSEPEPAVEVLESSQGEKQSSDPEPPTSSALVVYSDFIKPLFKKPKVVIYIRILAPTPLNSIRPVTFKNVPFEQFTVHLFNSISSEFSPTPPPRIDDK
ncbi:hypothetical protein Tco_1355152 [Tanacetum coccineum]